MAEKNSETVIIFNTYFNTCTPNYTQAELFKFRLNNKDVSV